MSKCNYPICSKSPRVLHVFCVQNPFSYPPKPSASPQLAVLCRQPPRARAFMSYDPAKENASSSQGASSEAPLPTVAEHEAMAWLGGARLVVWDFDMTILKIHAFGDEIEPHEVAARWREDVADTKLFRAFIVQAHETGVGVGIASYGRADVIGEYLEHIVPGAFRPQDIVTSGSLGLPDITDGMQVPNGKVLMLDLLCSRASPAVTDRSAVLFFDDDPENIRDCLRAGFTRSTHTPDAFTRRALAAATLGAKRGADLGAKRGCALA